MIGPRPNTAGIPIDLATIAVWLVGPPISVTKPITCLRSTDATSEGVGSWVTSTTGWSGELTMPASGNSLRNSRRSRSIRST